MKTLLAQFIEKKHTALEKTHIIREFLQILILKILADTRTFSSLVFLGGTALRILYGIRRYSEDLDFSLYNNNGYDFDALVSSLEKQLRDYGFTCSFKVKKQTTHSCFVIFEELLYDLEISSLKSQNLSIKIEIDTNPPLGGNIETSMIHEHFMFAVKHHDLSSLLSGKLHAIFERPFVKGRDYYDLLWYLSKGIIPHFPFLNNALKQTNSSLGEVNEENWIELLQKKMREVDFSKVRNDIQMFLMDKNELELLSKENFLSVIQKNF